MSRLPNPAEEHHQPHVNDLPLFGANPGTESSWPAGAPAAPPLYPDYIAQTHNGISGARWELALQGMFPPGPGLALADPPPDFDPLDDDWEIPEAQKSFDQLCPGWAAIGECENYHPIAKKVFCNREWCQGECGGESGEAHQRRKAAWLPKARQISSMGRFVFTIPPELRPEYRTRAALGKVGTSVKRALQYHGFDRGLRRWHWFGELDTALDRGQESPGFHPHLEILVDGNFIPAWKLDRIKQSWGNILGVPLDRVNVYYEFIQPHDTRRKLHRVGYALRPTFLDWRWDPVLAAELRGFRGMNSWGKWDGPAVWDVPADPDEVPPTAELEAAVSGHCPQCAGKIRWLGIISIEGWKEKVGVGWSEIGGGYYQGPGDPKWS